MAVIETAPWKKGDIIRNAKTGTPLLVIHVYTNLATMVANLTNEELQVPVLLLQKDYKRYVKDEDMEVIESDGLFERDIIGWNLKPCRI